MQDILQQVAELFVGAIPTALLFIVLVLAYQFLIQGPLTDVLAKRRATSPQGAGRYARKAIADAEAKTAEYAERLRQSRAEAYKVREQRVKQWNAERDAALRRRPQGSRRKSPSGPGRSRQRGRLRTRRNSGFHRRSCRPGCPRRPARHRRRIPLESVLLQMRLFQFHFAFCPDCRIRRFARRDSLSCQRAGHELFARCPIGACRCRTGASRGWIRKLQQSRPTKSRKKDSCTAQ